MTLKSVRKQLWILAGVALLAFSGLAIWNDRSQHRQGVTGQPRIEADFELTDQQGNTRTDEDLAGLWKLVFFGFTDCPDVCPTTLAEVAVLFIGEVLGQMPCLLCWYQPAIMFPLAIVLGLGFWWQDRRVGRYGIALATGGAAVALWHVDLYAGLIPEPIQPCTATGPSCTDENQMILGLPIPALSLAAFAFIAVLSALSLKETA